jgi:S1-C subfamily serine protease
MYQQVKPAVVLVQVQVTAQIQVDLDDQRLNGQQRTGASAAGWLITPDGHLVTHGHVVDLFLDGNDAELEQRLLFEFLRTDHIDEVQRHVGRTLGEDALIEMIPDLVQQSRVEVVKNLQVVLQNGDRYTAVVKQFSPGISPLPGRISFPGGSFRGGQDVALLKIEGRDLPSVALRDSRQLSPGDEIHVAGYPGVAADHPFLSARTAMEPSFTRGSVSNVAVAVAGAEVMRVDAPTTRGYSGGPIFNGRGEVVGMTTFGSLAPESDGSAQAIQGFNFAVPAPTIMAFVRAEGIDPASGPFDRAWATALDAYDAERWNAAVDALDAVLQVYPGLPDALRLRSAASAHTGMEPTMPWTTTVLVGGGLLVLAATGVSLRRRGTAHGALDNG